MSSKLIVKAFYQHFASGSLKGGWSDDNDRHH